MSTASHPASSPVTSSPIQRFDNIDYTTENLHIHATGSLSCAMLCELLTCNGTPRIQVAGVSGILQSIQREDGSGRSFIITLLDEANHTHQLHIRCN